MDHLIENFDFGSIGAGTIVDVGGSHGQVSISIARPRLFPPLNGTTRSAHHSYSPARQTNLVRIAHPQQQLQITVLRRSQSLLCRHLCTLPRLPNNPDTVIAQQTCQNSVELDLGKFGTGAVLRAVRPGEICALLVIDEGFLA